MSIVYFDDSLPALVHVLLKKMDRAFVEEGTVLRDASGHLCFVARRKAESDEEREGLKMALIETLGPYARPDRPIIFSDDFGAQALLDSGDRIPVQIKDVFCFLIDRRIVGAGWLEAPSSILKTPPRIVFATLKGGVGRSTALAIAAMDLARRNHNVLVIDMDLEAPGVGHMILHKDRIPEFGVTDFLVENGILGVDLMDARKFIGTSSFTSESGGRVDVMPALGKRSMEFPQNVLPKLSRAMIEDITEDGCVTVSDQISSMIERITNFSAYDVVLIDSRAGLSELAAPAILGLGATVLLFGTAQIQTIDGYQALFAGLHLLAQRDRNMGSDAEWRASLRPVYAKASGVAAIEDAFRDDLYDLYSEHLYDKERPEEDEDTFRFTRHDETAPHSPIVIPFNPTFVDFDPGRTPAQLSESFYGQTYRSFLNEINAIIDPRTNV